MPKYNQPRKTWRYPTAFKVKAVQLSLQEGVQVNAVAAALDIHPFMLSRWRKEFREGKFVADKRTRVTGIAKGAKELDRIKALEQQVSQLQQENTLLKKWQRFLAEAHQSDIDSSRETGNSSE